MNHDHDPQHEHESEGDHVVSEGTDLDLDALTAIAAASTQHHPRHEPSVWLRHAAEAAVARTAARGPWPPGRSIIVPLVPLWPPPSAARPAPAHLCARCGDSSAQRVRGRYFTSGLAVRSDLVPGVLLKLAFELCAECAGREYGRPLPSSAIDVRPEPERTDGRGGAELIPNQAETPPEPR